MLNKMLLLQKLILDRAYRKRRRLHNHTLLLLQCFQYLGIDMFDFGSENIAFFSEFDDGLGIGEGAVDMGF